MKKKFVLVCLLLLFGLSLFRNFTPQPLIPEVNASPYMLPIDGDAWTENGNATYPWKLSSSYVEGQINPHSISSETLSWNGVNAADFATDGTYLYAGLKNGSVLRTTDGESWTVLSYYYFNGVYAVRVDSRGYLFVGANGLYYPLYRSTDHGESFHVVMNSSTPWTECLLWNIADDSSGNLYLATYGGWARIWKSTNGGAYGSWTLKLNATEDYDAYHFHVIYCDPDTDYLYASYGDDPRGELRSTDGGDTWSQITREGVTSIRKFKGHLYFGQDSAPDVITRTTDDVNFEVAMDTPAVLYSGTNNAFYIFWLTESINGVMYAGTYQPPTIWATYNGEQWVQLFDLTSQCANKGVRRLEYFKNWIYVAGSGGSFTFRFRPLDETSLQNIYFYNNVLNESTNQVTASEYLFTNTTRMINLNHALENVTVKVTGVYSDNKVPNGDFESWTAGEPDDWRTEGSGITISNSTDSVEGTYSIKINVTNTVGSIYSDTNVGNDWVEVIPQRWYVVSCYIKGLSRHCRPMLVLDQWDTEAGYVPSIKRSHWEPSDGCWHRISWTVWTQTWYNENLKDVKYWRYYIRCGSMLGQDWVSWLMDGFMIQLADETVNMTRFDRNNPQKTLAHNQTNNETALSQPLLTPYIPVADYTTSNISFKLNGQQYNFLNVDNGTKRTVTTFSYFYGQMNFSDINITNGIALITITGTRRVTVTPYSQVYFNAYEFANNQMQLTISAPPGTKSTTKIYCANKGEPREVYASNGNVSWSYDDSSMMLEVRVSHLGPAEIIVDWRRPGDVDGDGDVDLDDLYYVLIAYGTKVGDSDYNPSADINRDDQINLDDLYYVLWNYD